MPGEPAESMIGVGVVGFGLLLVVAAYKNKSPVAIVTNAVTKGSFDISKVPDLVYTAPKETATWHWPPNVTTALTDIGSKDAALAAEITKELQSFDSYTPYDKTKHFFDLMSQARGEGFDAQASIIENYVNQLLGVQ